MNRYSDDFVFYTARDPLADLIVHLEYLAAKDYTVELLTTRHGVTLSDAKARAKIIGPHVRFAGAYIEQALQSLPEVSFLPAYYAILNLIKVYILFGPRHSELPRNRWHGASYPGFEKDSRSLETEVIELHPRGAIPLCHQTITGQAIKKQTRIKLGDLYPYLLDVGVEWEMATGSPSKVAGINIKIKKVGTGRRVDVKIRHSKGETSPALRALPLRKLTKTPGVDGEFVSEVETDDSITDRQLSERHVNHQLLYLNEPPMVPISARKLLLPEELPIALVFFHLSSIVRYKPEFLAELRDSKYWPVVASVRWHCMYKFLRLFSSFVQQKTVRINPLL